jgi:isopentenyl diphosphate isomerase/L-lactate dehydrogenase-like FMN-dependent dehydrogenase
MLMLTAATVLQAEIDTCLKLLGVKNVSELGPRHVSSHPVSQPLLPYCLVC